MDSDLFRLRYARLFLRQTWDFVRLLLGFVPALLGTLHNIVPFSVVRLIVRFLPHVNRSTIALERLGLGIPIYGGWYAFVYWLMADYFLPWVAATWSVLMVFAGIFALEYWPRAGRIGLLWWSELRLLLNPSKLRQLRREHLELRHTLEGLVTEYRTTHPVAEDVASPTWRRFVTRRLLGGSTIPLLLIVLLFAGFVIARRTQLSVLRPAGMELRHVPPAQLSTLIADDERSLSQVLAGLTGLEAAALKLKAELVAGKRDFYTQTDNDFIRQQLFSYLSYRSELLRLVWTYQNYRHVSDDKLRLRAFLVGLTSASALYDASYKFVSQFAQTPAAIRKLNEGEPLWDIPTGLYDTIRANLGAPKDRRLMRAALGEYDDRQNDFARYGLVQVKPYDSYHKTIAGSLRTLESLKSESTAWLAAAPVEDAKKIGKGLLYRGQSLLSTVIGDTRVRQPRRGQALIKPQQLEELRAKLKPGDILLERQNWFLSRAFMPGYWAHAALYVGTVDDLRKLGLENDARVKPFWNRFAAQSSAGNAHTILEAVPRGVRMTTLEHCIGVADSAAALRPRIKPDRLPEVIAQAFSHLDKPYDFEFDFFSTDKLVCTELVYRSCGNEIELPLAEVMGRKTLPPTEIARLFADQSKTSNPSIGFVAFLDGEESKGRATFKGPDEFAKTISRPSLTWLNQ